MAFTEEEMEKMREQMTAHIKNPKNSYLMPITMGAEVEPYPHSIEIHEAFDAMHRQDGNGSVGPLKK